MKIIDSMYYTDTHVYFWRNKTPFSNFYRRPFTYKGYALQFSEQGFMMEKAFLFDPSKVDVIAKATQPDKAKALGRAVQNYDDAVWSSVRYGKMVEVLRAKFKEPLMRNILLHTFHEAMNPTAVSVGTKTANTSESTTSNANI